jgi:hypothetical protein
MPYFPQLRPPASCDSSRHCAFRQCQLLVLCSLTGFAPPSLLRRAGLVRAISGEHRRAEDRTDESDARRTISPDSSDRHRTPGHASNSNIPNSPDTNIRPFNPSSTMLEENYIKSPRRGQGQGSIRSLVEGGGHHESPEARSMSPLRPSSALARSLHPNESSAKSFSTVASSRKNSGWIKSQNEESKFTKYPSTWEAGGAVYGMHWVDLTSAGIRELALGCPPRP